MVKVKMKSRIDKTKYLFNESLIGTMFWYKNGKRHREKDLPAIIYYNGDMYWYKNGIQHREKDKPAIINHNGDMSWFENGKLIRKIKK